MIQVRLDLPSGRASRILCLGAHSDDIEIGCGGTILRLLQKSDSVDVRWVIFSGGTDRSEEAEASAALFLERAQHSEVQIHQFRDGFFPFCGHEIKEVFEDLKRDLEPDLVFTHHHQDLHQDHRLVSELTWNTFRNHLILEYEIPKYDGGLMTPNLFVSLDENTRQKKLKYLMTVFETQRNKSWFSAETFLGLMRIRGVECAAMEGYAEGFHARKTVVAI